ncbi:MAG TPA: heavy metal translocating P-type ATPase [Bacilli bacterium]|nr:heavy metal translocating P-type ATPase [Bacilli bacterium]
MKSYKFNIHNLDCANCARKIEEKLQANGNYANVSVNFSTLKLSFKSELDINKDDLEKEIQKIEDGVTLSLNNEEVNERNNSDIFNLIAGLAIFGISMLIKNNIISTILIIISTIILLYKVFVKATKQLFKSKILDENALITISVIGAMLVGKVHEGIMVITLYEIGKILESKAISKSRKSISDLMNIKVDYANVKLNKEIKSLRVEDVQINDIILVKVGEKIPLDGIIVKGSSQIDNSSLTGESKLVSLKKNDQILSGSINVISPLEIKVTKTYEDSTVNKILELVENATDKKAKTENFVSKAAKIYTPLVLTFACLFAIFVPLFTNMSYQDSIYKALVFLVISCPCSIAISVPLSYFSGIGTCSSRGILVKGSNYLDNLKDVKEIIFDKTGTITTGNFIISDIETLNKKYKKEELLKIAAYGESYSTHPIAKSIVNAYSKKILTNKISNFKENAGKGISYNLNNDNYKIGTANFVGYKKIDSLNTIVYISKNDEVIGYIELEDEIKNDVSKSITNLKRNNINTLMFTGDKKDIALNIASKVGINNVQYELLPQDKYHLLEEKINSKENGKIAFVGDGINDAPSLALADIGISMGGVGSSAAIEASDVVIMKDDISKINEAIKISKFTNKIIMQNLVFSIGVKIAILVLSALGITDMWEAVFADVGTTIITIINTLRILKMKR